jgi:hypothetical protein
MPNYIKKYRNYTRQCSIALKKYYNYHSSWKMLNYVKKYHNYTGQCRITLKNTTITLDNVEFH